MKYLILICYLLFANPLFSQEKRPLNVLIIIADDLNTGALGTYGNPLVKTPSIDQLAKDGFTFKNTYSQFPVCGPSRASLLFGYYPTATETYGYTSGRENVGPERESIPQFFKNRGYYTARVSKIFHMGVPGDIESGSHGQDDEASWTERFNSPGPEWKSPGKAELVQNNPDGLIERKGGNVMTIVESDGGDLSQSDGITAEKAIELIRTHKNSPFFLAVGLVRPHVPFVAPKEYFLPYPWQNIQPPPIIPNDWEDIPAKGINYVTTQNSEMNFIQKQKAITGYYASVSFMDRQVGKILQTLKEEQLDENTLVVFTSDHGFHLGEHDFWMKVSLKEESVKVPLIFRGPNIPKGSTSSFAELVDLFPTILDLTGHNIPERLQGESLVPMMHDPKSIKKDLAFSVSLNGKAFLVRTPDWAYIQYGEQAEDGMELFDMKEDPNQYTNLAYLEKYKTKLQEMKSLLSQKIQTVRQNDLQKTYSHD